MTHQRYKLKNIAEINSGYSFRTKIQNNSEGNTYVIQMRDISEDRSGITNKPHKVKGDKMHDKHFLQYGDVLFMAKGANNFAVCYNEKYKLAVAASAFFVIRPDQKLVNPKYLCWYINSRKAQAFLESNRAGSYIPNVNKAVINELEVIVPPLKLQNTIADLATLSRSEQKLLDQIIAKKQSLMNSILSNLIFKENG